MYTEENMEYNDNYDRNDYDNNSDNDNGISYGTLLIRILIIFICLLLVIWLISKLIGGKKVENDGTVFNSNIDNIRLASEKYFFLDNNLPENDDESVTITLTELNGQNLISEIKDYKGNACNTNAGSSYATITKTSVAYELKIKLTCNEEQREVTYYYDLEDGECLSCNGNTHMDGSLALGGSNNTDNKEDTDNNETNNDKTNVDDLEINCNKWSDWTTVKLNDDKLLVRTRTLLKGYKTTSEGINIIYGPWSDWQETPIISSDTLSVEVKQEIRPVWSELKTTTDKISNSDTIKIISVSTTPGEKVCDTSYKTVRKEVSYSEYSKLINQGIKVTVLDTYTKKTCTTDCESSYSLVYEIAYTKKTTDCENSEEVTTYTYQELTSQTVNLYRSQTITKEIVKGETVYTDWVEKLPEGYIKSDELIQYSYKDTVCK